MARKAPRQRHRKFAGTAARPAESQPAKVSNPLLLTARRRYAEICQRHSAFGDLPLLVEPSWQILLQLFVAQLERTHATLNEVVRLFPRLSSQTVERYIQVMEKEGLLECAVAPSDGDSQLVLTEKAVAMMSDALSPKR